MKTDTIVMIILTIVGIVAAYLLFKDDDDFLE